MPPKRAPKAPPALARSPAKKAPRPASTKKKQAPPKPAPKKVSQQLSSLLQDHSASARSIVDFVVGPTCGLESLHKNFFADMTPFLMAVFANRLDVVRLLVAEHPVDTKAEAELNFTALHIASRYGHLEMVRYLVEQCGLDVQSLDVNGNSSLHWAISNKHTAVVLLLLELGADPNHPDAIKWTPLHLACIFGLVDVARVLLAKGVTSSEVDTDGKTPLDLAMESNHREVAALFGAKP